MAGAVRLLGANPPVTVNPWLYGVPCAPFGNVVGAITGAAGRLITILNTFVPVCAGLLWSFTCTVKFAVPFGPVGVPVIFPVESIAKLAGKLPALMLNVSVPNPPVAATVWL